MQAKSHVVNFNVAEYFYGDVDCSKPHYSNSLDFLILDWITMTASGL